LYLNVFGIHIESLNLPSSKVGLNPC